MRSIRIVALAWLMSALTVAMVIASMLLLSAGSPAQEDFDYLPFLVVCAVVGSLIVATQHRNLVGWLLMGGAFSFALMSFTGHYALYGLFTNPGSLPAANALAWPQTWLWVPGAASNFLFLPLYFPNGQLLSSRWRIGVRVMLGAVALVMFVSAFSPGDTTIQVPAPDGSIVNPLGITAPDNSASTTLTSILNIVMPLVSFSLLCIAVTSLIIRYRRSGEAERKQMKWLTYAVVGLPVGVVAGRFFEPFNLLGGFYLVSIPIAVGIAILRHDLYDIDLIINRTLVYGALTTLVIGAYVLVVGFVGSVVLSEDNLLLSVAVTGVVAVLFQPVRQRVQRGVNRLMYGDRDEPYAVITRLGQRIEDTLTPDAVLPAIVETVAQALKVPYAAIALNGQTPAIAAATGTPVGAPVHLPLVYRNEPVGELILAPRRPGEAFTSADRRLLDDLTRQAGIAAHAVRLSTELQHSRERLVTAREEERRRLRRDLHDGLGPALASMTLQAEAARDLVHIDSRQSDELLAELTAGLQEATADIRRLVYGLRPPALDDLGLVPALRNYAARFGPQGPTVEIVASESFPPLPAAVEVAAYRIVQEALTNVMHHAGATRCIVTLQEARTSLNLDITDDGVGIPEHRESGVGLRSMFERAAELGGSCGVSRLPDGGTRVTAALPFISGERDA